MDKISLHHIKLAATQLIDNDRPTEYTRGICELIADIDGKQDTPHDVRSKQVAIELGIPETIASIIW